MDVITSSHRLTYKENMQLAIQQKRSKLDNAMMYVPGLSGRQSQFIEIFGATAVVMDLGRKADTPDIDSPVEGIWMTPRQVAWGKLMEKEDAIKRTQDPSSQFIQAGAAAMVRGGDKIRSAAMFGTRKIGQDGTTVSAWAGDTVTVGVGASATDDTTATGMNVRKLIRGQRLMQARQIEIDDESLHASVNAQGMEELYRDITYVNTDYRSKSVLEGKQVREIMGITIHVIDGDASLADYDGTTYTFAMWAKSGLAWGDFDPLTSDIPLRADKMNRPHPFSEWWLGASRTEDYKVVKVLSKK
jgi:hypothetical protein